MHGTIQTEHKAISEVKDMLKMWAQWVRLNTGRSNRLDYPVSAPFVNADQKLNGYTAFPVSHNDVAEQVERALCKLKILSPKVFEALKCEYLYEYTNKEAASYCRCSERIYKQRRDSGEHYVAGVML